MWFKINFCHFTWFGWVSTTVERCTLTHTAHISQMSSDSTMEWWEWNDYFLFFLCEQKRIWSRYGSEKFYETANWNETIEAVMNTYTYTLLAYRLWSNCFPMKILNSVRVIFHRTWQFNDSGDFRWIESVQTICHWEALHTFKLNFQHSATKK